MKCIHCNEEIPDDSVFCPFCGQKAEKPPVTPVKRCHICQASLQDGAKFCESCGAAVPAEHLICPACSAKISSDATFCPNCGHRIGGGAPAEDQKSPATQTSAQPAPPAAQQPAWTAGSYAQPQTYGKPQPDGQPSAPYPAYNYGTYPPAAKPKKKKGWLVAVIIIIILAVIGGGTALVFGKQIKRLLMGPKAAYLSLESAALKQQTDDLLTDLVKYGNTGDQDPQGGVDLELKVNLEADNLELDPTLAALLDNLSIRTTWIYDHSGTEKRNFTAIDLMTQEEKLLTLEAFIEQDRMVMGLPEILNAYVAATYEELGGFMGLGETSLETDGSFSALMQLAALDLGIDQADMQASVYKMIDIVLEHIDSVEYEKNQTLTVGTVSAAYELYTVTLSSENARAMVLELLDHLRVDKEIYNMVSKISSLSAMIDPYSYAYADLTFSDYQDAIDQAIADLNDDTDSEPFTLVQKVYVGADDEVFGRDLQYLDEDDETVWQLQVLHPVKDGQEAWLISFDDDYDSMLATAEYAIENEQKTGTASLTVADEEILQVTFTDFYLKPIGGDDFPMGKATFSFAGETGMPDELSVSGYEESGRFWLEAGVPDYGSLEIGYRTLTAAEARIPAYDEGSLASISDPDALSGLVSETAYEKIMDIMQKLGLTEFVAP